VVKDLDEIDDAARDQVNLLNKSTKIKDEWTDEEFLQHQVKRQELLNKFLSDNSGKSIILAGFHSEGGGQYAINVPTLNKFLLDTDAATSAQRAYQRSLESKHVKNLEDLPHDVEEAQADIEAFTSMGYTPRSTEQIIEWIGNNI